MSHRTALIHLYDVMDRIQVSVTITDHDEEDGSAQRTYHRATTVAGLGDSRDLSWLSSAVTRALEEWLTEGPGTAVPGPPSGGAPNLAPSSDTPPWR